MAGIEDVEDLIDDLDKAFKLAAKTVGVHGSGAAAKNGALGPTAAREDELLRKIAMLEAQLK